jgi:hypothetical protein
MVPPRAGGEFVDSLDAGWLRRVRRGRLICHIGGKGPCSRQRCEVGRILAPMEVETDERTQG